MLGVRVVRYVFHCSEFCVKCLASVIQMSAFKYFAVVSRSQVIITTKCIYKGNSFANMHLSNINVTAMYMNLQVALSICHSD